MLAALDSASPIAAALTTVYLVARLLVVAILMPAPPATLQPSSVSP
jgi:hypothetical protein